MLYHLAAVLILLDTENELETFRQHPRHPAEYLRSTRQLIDSINDNYRLFIAVS